MKQTDKSFLQTKLNNIFYPGDGKSVRKMSPEQHTTAKKILNY